MVDYRQKISLEEYRLGVECLLRATHMYGTSGSRAAALVLLSAYNASEWRLDVTEMCILDSENYEAALAVIRGRIEIGTEPHRIVKGGDDIFNELWDRYIRFHISNSYK